MRIIKNLKLSEYRKNHPETYAKFVEAGKSHRFKKGRSGLKGYPDDITKEKISKSVENSWKDPKIREKHIQNMRGKKRQNTINYKRASKRRWLNKEYAEMMFRKFKKRPTKLELFFIRLFQRKKLPYKYVGDGQFWIGGKCPDFVNVNGKKICIEVGSKKEKSTKRKGRGYATWEHYKEQRIRHFAKWGWTVNFYWIEDFTNG